MSRKLLRDYRFATEAQWDTCLFVGADRDSREARSGFRPFVPYASPAIRFETQGANAPAVTCVGELLWRDNEGNLQRVSYGDDKHIGVRAPFAIASATRLVATSNALWTIDAAGSLQAFHPEDLARQFVVDIPNARVLDLAGDGHDGLFVLFERKGAWEITRCDCAGRLNSGFVLKGVSEPSALVYLRGPDRLVVLSDKRQKLHWFTPSGDPAIFSIALTAICPCFDVAALGSDGRVRLFLAGTDGAAFGGRHQVLTLDSEGNLLGRVEVGEKPTGVTSNRSHLLVTAARGLLRFDTSPTLSAESSEVRAGLITPMLQSPSTEDLRRWLRVEATITLPAGSTLEISCASTDDHETRDTALRFASDPSMPASQRMQRLRSYLGPWRTISFHGGDTVPVDKSVPLSVPLFDVREQYLWVSITLIASPGSEIPVLSPLVVLYPGRTLMENLPAVYQRAESQSGSFLRSLVGVLEATTQTLDARIADMGRYVHPRTASGPWLDFIARWLGLPWDDALSLDQKRAITEHAAEIANGRGTRAGLEALLNCLMPEEPRRYRVIDVTADFGLATVGGGTCGGSRLPVVLGGLPSTATELGNKAILGLARLPCANSDGDTAWLAGRIRVDVTASPDEQAKWQPWLRALIGDMVPAMASVQVRWLDAVTFQHEVQLDEALQLGSAQLPGQRGTSLSSTGADSGSPLY